MRLTELRYYCVSNYIFELHLPKICSGIDKFNFDIIHKNMLDILKESHIKIFVHIKKKEINIDDIVSLLAQFD